MTRRLRTTVRVADGGRIVIPAEVREKLGFEVGTDVVMTVEDDQATIMSVEAAQRKACEIVAKYVPQGVSLSEELMAERKKEAEGE